MGHEYRDEDELTVDASPDEVWEAIATGPGMNAWFMGHTTVTGGECGAIRVDMGQFTQDFTITGWQPGRRLAYTTDPRPDGSFLALEWLIEGRSGTTILRSVGSGFIGSDDWQDEYDSLRQGGRRYLLNVGQYLTFFRGRAATPVNAGWPQAGPRADVLRTLTHGLGLAGLPRVGDAVRLAPPGLPPIHGVVVLGDQCTDGGGEPFGEGGPVGCRGEADLTVHGEGRDLLLRPRGVAEQRADVANQPGRHR